MAYRAALAAHGQSEAHRQVQAGQAGLFGHMTPEDRGAAVQDRTATVGTDYGGRPLERNGGTFRWSDVSDSPAPALVDRRFIDRPGVRPTGESPLAAYMRNRGQ